LAPDAGFAELDTFYDLASLTKPFVAMSALRLAQSQRLDLQAPAAALLPEITGLPGGESSLAELLCHRAGLSPWGGLFRETDAAPGSPEARRFILAQAAARAEPGARKLGSVYSDLGYILAGEALARAAGRPLEQVVREQVTEPLGICDRVFYAAAEPVEARGSAREQNAEVWANRGASVAPTERCGFRGRVLAGEVHDENCYAFGGISGHAGLFGQAEAVLELGLALLDVLDGRSRWLDQALLRWALAPRPGGGYVLGWDTKSADGSSAGALFSARSFGHLGFTGTSIWCDPARALCAVLLTNRVHPTRENIEHRDPRLPAALSRSRRAPRVRR
jgi:CubicO group peptidase (beta-lactamase class C family)